MSIPDYVLAFYSLFVERHGSIFESDIGHEVTDDGRLLFRGPVLFQPGSEPGVGTHAVVELETELLAEIAAMDSTSRDRAFDLLLTNLGSQLRTQYSRQGLGKFAFKVVGTKAIIASS